MCDEMFSHLGTMSSVTCTRGTDNYTTPQFVVSNSLGKNN